MPDGQQLVAAADVEELADDQQAVLRQAEDAFAVFDQELDLADPADLEAFRRELPTDPAVAELVHAGMPRPLREALEFVDCSDSERQSSYWRVSRERSDPGALSNAELRQRRAFIKSRINHREDGVERTTDGRYISRSAARTGEDLRGESFREPDDPPTKTVRERGRRFASKVRRALGL